MAGPGGRGPYRGEESPDSKAPTSGRPSATHGSLMLASTAPASISTAPGARRKSYTVGSTGVAYSLDLTRNKVWPVPWSLEAAAE